MRQLLWFTILFIALACNDKDEEAENNLVGSWVAINFAVANCEDIRDNDTGNIDCSDLNCQRYIFSDSTTFIVQITTDGATQSESGTLNVDGDRLTLCSEDEEEVICEVFSFVLDENSLTLSEAADSTGCVRRVGYLREATTDTLSSS